MSELFQDQALSKGFFRGDSDVNFRDSYFGENYSIPLESSRDEMCHTLIKS